VPPGWTLTSATCDNGNDPAAITLDAGETVTCTFVNNIDVLEIASAVDLCLNDTPYVDYVVQNVPATPRAPEGPAGTGITVRWIAIEDGSNDVIEEITNAPLSDRLLWPGAVLDANGDPIDWPGWDFIPGVGWVEVPTNLRPTMLLEFEANNVVSQVVNYPPATPTCSPNPETFEAVEVPTLSPRGLAALVLLMLTLGGLAARRQRHRA
jgi:hypothetical protein